MFLVSCDTFFVFGLAGGAERVRSCRRIWDAGEHGEERDFECARSSRLSVCCVMCYQVPGIFLIYLVEITVLVIII